jgi:hypothetical protein
MSLTKLSLVGIIKLFLLRENLVNDIPAGDGNVANLFLRCWVSRTKLFKIFAKSMENSFLFFIEDMQIFKTKIKLSVMFEDFKIISFSRRQSQECD